MCIEKKVAKLHRLYLKLLSIIEKHEQGELDSQIRTVKDIITYINSISNRTLIHENHMEKIKKMYISLFPPRGGLTDFFIWSNNYEERIRLNEPLDKLRKEIWEILRDR